MTSQIKTKKAAVLRILECRIDKPIPHFPSDDSVINAIIPKTSVYDDEHQAEHITCSDYDDWVEQALFDLTRRPIRFQRHPENPGLIECPRARLLRIGNEAELAGTPSDIFRFLMIVTDHGRKLPHVTKRALQAAQSSLNIADEFVNFVKVHKMNFRSIREMKARFHIADQRTSTARTRVMIERALRDHGINWSAYAVANKRKGKRGTKKIS